MSESPVSPMFVEFSQEGRLLFIRFPERILNDEAPLLKESIQRWLGCSEKVLVFDMRRAIEIQDRSLGVLKNFLALIHLNEKRVTSIRPGKKLMEQLRDQDVFDLFHFRKESS